MSRRAFPKSLAKQLGFLFLTTGANGSGKTLFTLLDVRELQLETSRPVFFSGFTAKQPLLDFGWREFEPEQWQDCPDGSILIIDECHLKLPLRGAGKPPEWIEMIPVTHRKRGMDVFFITQHPMNMDAFIRRVIATPGWHRHFKASFMGDSSNELKWTAVKDQPQKPGTGKDGEVRSRAFPKQVYDWYESASIHTAKKGIPRKVWVGIGALVLAVLSVLAVVKMLAMQVSGEAVARSSLAKDAKPAETSTPGQARVQGEGGGSKPAPMTIAEYVELRRPRLPDFPHTSPAYDQVTQPTVAPYPAACVQMGDKCKCYTQQATLLRVSAEICHQIVQQGYFVDWQQPQPREVQRQQAHQLQPLEAQSVQQVRTVPMPQQAPAQDGLITPEQLSSALGVRNPAYAGLPRISSR